MAIHSTLGILLDVCVITRFIRRYPSDNQVNQTADGLITSSDVLAEMLESIEYWIRRLRMYAEMSHSMPVVDEMAIKLMVELFSTLALVNRKLKCESFLPNMLLCSARRSRTGEEFFRGQGDQQSTSEA